MKIALVLAALLCGSLGACGDDGAKPNGDAGMDAPMPDAPVTAATLTSYVIDLVQNHTTATDTPRAYSEFQALPDPDGSNGSAYAPLFP